MTVKNIILDTNFLIYCAENKIDYVIEISQIMNQGYSLIIPIQVIFELEEISKTSKKFSDKTAAELALKLIKVNEKEGLLKIITPLFGGQTDEIIKKLSINGNIVATLDLGLRKRIKNSIVIKSKKKLALE